MQPRKSQMHSGNYTSWLAANSGAVWFCGLCSEVQV